MPIKAYQVKKPSGWAAFFLQNLAFMVKLYKTGVAEKSADKTVGR